LRLFLGRRLGRGCRRIASEPRRAQGLDPADGRILPLAVFPHRSGLVSIGLLVSHLSSRRSLYASVRSRAIAKIRVVNRTPLGYHNPMADADDILAKDADSLRRDRDLLVEQIRRSQETIARSQELLKQIDGLLARIEQSKT
jgi:hypothetical protein